MTRRTFRIETKQLDGAWLGHVFTKGPRPRSLPAAKRAVDEAHATYHCPKRAVDEATGEVVYTVGDTPEWAAHCARVNAAVEAQARSDAAVLRAAATLEAAAKAAAPDVPRYTIDTDLRPAMQAQGFTCCVLDHNSGGMGVTTAIAYCFYMADAERIADTLIAAERIASGQV